jgi:hypothetical protein
MITATTGRSPRVSFTNVSAGEEALGHHASPGLADGRSQTNGPGVLEQHHGRGCAGAQVGGCGADLVEGEARTLLRAQHRFKLRRLGLRLDSRFQAE